MAISPRLTAGRRTRRARATTTSRRPPKTMWAAPTATGDPPGPIACAVPVVPKHVAARRTWRRAGIVGLLNNHEGMSSGRPRPGGPFRGRRPCAGPPLRAGPRHSPVAAMPVARLTLIAAAALALLAAPAHADSTGLVSARVGQPPLSDAAAATKVRRSSFEPRPANASATHRVPTEAQLSALH